jgi:hypothetical protein
MARDRATTQEAPACGMASQNSRNCPRFDLHGLIFCIKRSRKESRLRLGERALRWRRMFGASGMEVRRRGVGRGQGERGAGFPLRERLRSPPPSQEQRELVGGCIGAG